MAMAQTKITGSVVDDKGEPIIGASYYRCWGRLSENYSVANILNI